jgi:hypothetical protein
LSVLIGFLVFDTALAVAFFAVVFEYVKNLPTLAWHAPSYVRIGMYVLAAALGANFSDHRTLPN